MTDATPLSTDLLQRRLARRMLAALEDDDTALAPDVTARLAAARGAALALAREARSARLVAAPRLALAGMPLQGPAPSVRRPQGGPSRWTRLGTLIPLLALVSGLVLIHESTLRARIRAAADIDAALLADDLPLGAYDDPAFVEFLKADVRP